VFEPGNVATAVAAFPAAVRRSVTLKGASPASRGAEAQTIQAGVNCLPVTASRDQGHLAIGPHQPDSIPGWWQANIVFGIGAMPG
jgi:hypothetical protein